MKKALSRVLSLALVLVMVLGIMPMAAADTTNDFTITASPETGAKVGDTITFSVASIPTIDSGISGVTYTASSWAWSGCVSGSSANQITFQPETAGEHTVNCTITYVSSDGRYPNRDMTASLTVTVESATPAVEYDVTFSDEKVVLLPGGEYTIVNPVVTASDESDMSGLTWTWTTDSDKITIVGNTITAGAAAGTATVTGTPSITAVGTVTFPVEVLSGVTVSADAVELNVGEDKSIVLKSEPATSGLTATYKSANEKIAKVDASGKVTGVTEGQTTVTVVVTAPEGTILAGAESSGTNAGKKILTVAVNVKDGAYIKADNFSLKQGDTHSLVITPVGVPADAVITYGYQVKDTTAATLSAKTNTNKDSNVVVTAAKKDAVSEITVTASYKVGNADPVALDPINVKFSVYSEHTTKVQLLDTVTKSFTLADKKIFKSASYDGGTFPAYLDESLLYLLSESGAQYITLVEAYGSDDIGTLKVANSTTGRANVNTANRIVFTLNGKSGTAIFNYTLENADNLVIAKGTLYIETAGSAADITYTTTAGNAVTIDEDDFKNFWKKYGTGTLDHVTFDVSTLVPAYGSLYTAKTGNKKVTWTMEFVPNFTSSTNTNRYDLDTVTYVPGTVKTKYVEEIPFTCVSNTNTTMSGVMAIEVSNKLPFTDVKESHWFYDSVAYVYNKGIMNGTTDTLFSPNDTLTRAMVVTMLYRIEGQPSTTFKGTFSDVKSGQWYSSAVEWAAKNDIVNGMGDGSFGYAKAITREQFAAILYRYADYKNISTSGASSLTKFSDYKTVSTYAESALKWAVYEGIINGDNGKLLPKGTATRAQAAKMIHYFLEGSSINVSGDDNKTTATGLSFYANDAVEYLEEDIGLKRNGFISLTVVGEEYVSDTTKHDCVGIVVYYKYKTILGSTYSDQMVFVYDLDDNTVAYDATEYYDWLADSYANDLTQWEKFVHYSALTLEANALLAKANTMTVITNY